jgi:hypothetical protein
MDAKFLAKIEKQPDGCWIWMGASIRGCRGGRYAYITRGGKNWLGHRWVFVQTNGSIPDTLVIDHTCKNTLCVNPLHLEAVTNQVNTRRGRIGFTKREHFSQRSSCRQGHPLTPENLRFQTTRPKGRINPDGTPYEFQARRCRLCEKLQREKRKGTGR